MSKFFRLMLLFLSFPIPAFADFPALNYQYRYSHSYHGTYIYGSTPAEACSRANSREDWSNYNFVGTLLSDTVCRISTSKPETSPYIDATIQRQTVPAYCPSNATLSAGMCSCDAGYEEDGASCVPVEPPDPCEFLADMCSGSQGKISAFSLSGKKTGVSFTCMSPLSFGGDLLPGCTKGCMAQVGGFTTAFQSDDGNWVTQGTAKFTGSTCDPSVINDLNSQADPEYEPEDEPNLTDKPDCPNGFKGTVNGVSVCVPPKASEGLLEKEEKDNGDGTKTEKQTKVKCENGVCEITTTTITKDTTSNTVVSSSSATTTVEKGKFCSDNPTASACKDDSNSEEGKKGSFSGSCQAGFECDGDAAMCAIAIEQHKRACETLEPVKEGIWKDIEAGTDSGSAEAMKREAQTINISTSLNTSGYGLPRSCPADPVIELPFVSKTFSIPFSKACPILKTMSDVALLITALGLLVWLVAPKGKAE